MSVSVLIGIPCRESAPSSGFYQCLEDLQRPEGTRVYHAMTGVLPGARNRICRKAQEIGAEWIWMLDNDQLFAPDALVKLLAHDRDVVLGLTLKRKAPFYPLLLDMLPDGQCYQRYLNPGDHGLIPIAAAGMGGVLIRRSVIDAIPDPWFLYDHDPTHPDDYAEEFPFYRAVRDLGIQPYCDLSVLYGHTMTSIVWPVRQPNGTWISVFSEDKPFAGLPQPVSDLVPA